MLVGRQRSVAGRVVAILTATALVTAGGVVGAFAAAKSGLIDWPPRPSSPFGVALGFALAAFVAFEMALLPRKWLRGRRLGSTRVWMRLHVWVGLAGLPVVLLHAGFGLGGPVPAATLILFLAVTASGIWGLILQQWLPTKMLTDVPGETVASQIDRTGEYHAKEAERIVRVVERDDDRRVYKVVIPRGKVDDPLGLDADDPEDVYLDDLAAKDLILFRDGLLGPYLSRGPRSGSPLRHRTEAERRFKRLRDGLPAEAQPAIDRLAELADLRRQWDRLSRLNFWLHSWLLVHLPLSVAMAVLMVVHAIRALKYW